MEARTYQLALQLAQSELQKASLDEVAAKAGVHHDNGLITVPYLNRHCAVQVNDQGVQVLDDQGNEAPVWQAIVVLHYLLTASGEPLADELVDFRQLVGGEGYLPNFSKRAANRLAMIFGNDAAGFLEAGLALGGQELDRGDAALRMPVLPRVPVWLIVWEADDEFPPSVKIVFDASINGYLPTEDVVVVCQQLVTQLSEV